MVSAEHPSTPEDRTSQLTASFTETARGLFSAGSAADTLRAVVDLAVETIEGCDFASIFVVDGDQVTTSAGTDPVAAEVDVAQHHAGEGPGLDAITQGGTVYVEELTDDQRWVRFGAEAAAAGVRSALAIRLSGDATRGAALCLYARYPRAFGALDRAKGSSSRRSPAEPSLRPRSTTTRPATLSEAALTTQDDDRPGARDPHGARTHHCRPGLRRPAPGEIVKSCG